jgi:hypothetical protein
MDVGDAGKGEYLLGMEEWEEAVRVLEGAWERGRGEDVSFFFTLLWFAGLHVDFFIRRSNNVFRERSDCLNSPGRRIIIKSLECRGMPIRRLLRRLCECSFLRSLPFVTSSFRFLL